MKIRFLAALIFTILAISVVCADDAYERLRREGFNYLYSMEYDAALTRFQAMVNLEPNNPAGYIYSGSTVWLQYLASLRRLQTALYNRNDSFFTKTIDHVDQDVDKRFHSEIDEGIRIAEARISANKNDVNALYYLGVARGAIAGYETTVKRSFFSSLKSGSEAVRLHREVLKKDPTFTDSYLSIGMYDYVVGSLPLAVKVLAFLGGVHGSKKDGLIELERVEKEGHYARDEAAVILVLLYDREKRVSDSLKVLQSLCEKYPRNFLFRIETASTLIRLKRFKESVKIFEELLEDKHAMDYMPDLVHYRYAQALFDAHAWQKAYEQYIAASGCAQSTEAVITLSRLEAGKCMDALGNRKQAETEYQFVLKRPPAFDSRDLAKRYLKKPYTPTSSSDED